MLPKISPVYAALVDLKSADLNVRRRGAKTLADRGQAATLSRPVLVRLRELLAHENDDLVWRSAMTAVASDADRRVRTSPTCAFRTLCRASANSVASICRGTVSRRTRSGCLT